MPLLCRVENRECHPFALISNFGQKCSTNLGGSLGSRPSRCGQYLLPCPEMWTGGSTECSWRLEVGWRARWSRGLGKEWNFGSNFGSAGSSTSRCGRPIHGCGSSLAGTLVQAI